MVTQSVQWLRLLGALVLFAGTGPTVLARSADSADSSERSAEKAGGASAVSMGCDHTVPDMSDSHTPEIPTPHGPKSTRPSERTDSGSKITPTTQCTKPCLQLAFTSGLPWEHDIWLITVKTRVMVNLTKHPGRYSDPVWSPDGKRLLFMSDRDHPWKPLQGTPYFDLYMMNADGTAQRRVTNCDFVGGDPAWSPDGKIAFTCHRSGVTELGVLDASGMLQKTLKIPESLSISDLGWSPDGRRLAFTATDRPGEVGSYRIYVTEVTYSEEGVTRLLTDKDDFFTRLLADKGDSDPEWSPDGRRIVFMSKRDGNPEIYVMNADGSEQRNLTNDRHVDTRPHWSPDGQSIGFASSRNGNGQIYKMAADGSGLVNLTKSNDNDTFYGFSWSPNGEFIAFFRGGPLQGQLWIMRSDGSEQRRLTNDKIPDANFQAWRSCARR